MEKSQKCIKFQLRYSFNMSKKYDFISINYSFKTKENKIMQNNVVHKFGRPAEFIAWLLLLWKAESRRCHGL